MALRHYGSVIHFDIAILNEDGVIYYTAVMLNCRINRGNYAPMYSEHSVYISLYFFPLSIITNIISGRLPERFLLSALAMLCRSYLKNSVNKFITVRLK